MRWFTKPKPQPKNCWTEPPIYQLIEPTTRDGTIASAVFRLCVKVHIDAHELGVEPVLRISQDFWQAIVEDAELRTYVRFFPAPRYNNEMGMLYGVCMCVEAETLYDGLKRNAARHVDAARLRSLPISEFTGMPYDPAWGYRGHAVV